MAFPVKGKAAQWLTAGGVMCALLAPLAHAEEPQWDSGEQLYVKVCGHCHEPAVGVGPALGGRTLPEPYIRAIVRNGFNAMPAFPASFIDDASLAAVTEYLATLPGPAEQP